MENNRFLLKVSRLFPSSLTSCRFRTTSDVAEKSMTLSETNNSSPEIDLSSLFKKPAEKDSNKNPNTVPKNRKRCQFLGIFSDIKGKKNPPMTLFPDLNRKQRFQERKKGNNNIFSIVNQSCPSNYIGGFNNNDKKSRRSNTFFNLSSISDHSFRKSISHRFRKRHDEMKSIDEMEHCSFSSLTSFNTVLTNCSGKATKNPGEINVKKTKDQKSVHTCPNYELGFDQISTHIYYSKGTSYRRRKTSRNRRKMKKNNMSTLVEDCHAVEKNSRDPRGDFKASMVEMIVEKQMFGSEDLEKLLGCFLSLNSTSYHRIIVDVFYEVCQTLFSY